MTNQPVSISPGLDNSPAEGYDIEGIFGATEVIGTTQYSFEVANRPTTAGWLIEPMTGDVLPRTEDKPTLLFVKSWSECDALGFVEDKRRELSLLSGDSGHDLRSVSDELNHLAESNLERAAQQAERIAVWSGRLASHRSSSGLFLDAPTQLYSQVPPQPADPFCTLRELEQQRGVKSGSLSFDRSLGMSLGDEAFRQAILDSYHLNVISPWVKATPSENVSEMMTIESALSSYYSGLGLDHLDAPKKEDPANPDPNVARFRDEFADSKFRLLEPVNPQVNYSFEVMAADPWTLELRADKWWFNPDGQLENDPVTLATYPHERDELLYDGIREEANMQREELIRLHADHGLKAAMDRAGEIAVQHGELEAGDRPISLFEKGPDDPRINQVSKAYFTGLVDVPSGVPDKAGTLGQLCNTLMLSKALSGTSPAQLPVSLDPVVWDFVKTGEPVTDMDMLMVESMRAVGIELSHRTLQDAGLASCAKVFDKVNELWIVPGVLENNVSDTDAEAVLLLFGYDDGDLQTQVFSMSPGTVVETELVSRDVLDTFRSGGIEAGYDLAENLHLGSALSAKTLHPVEDVDVESCSLSLDF